MSVEVWKGNKLNSGSTDDKAGIEHFLNMIKQTSRHKKFADNMTVYVIEVLINVDVDGTRWRTMCDDKRRDDFFFLRWGLACESCGDWMMLKIRKIGEEGHLLNACRDGKPSCDTITQHEH
jgi:hypothetical protein